MFMFIMFFAYRNQSRYPEYINRFSGAKRQKVLSTRTFLYVPLFDTLSQLLHNKEILGEINATKYYGDEVVLKDYSDGSFYKNYPLFTSKHCKS